MRGARVALPLVLAWSAGCASASSFQSARTLGRGNVEIALEPALQSGRLFNGMRDAQLRTDVSFRGGVGERVDLAGRVGSGGLAVEAKVGLVDPSKPYALALVPSVAGWYVNATDYAGRGYCTLSLPVLASFGRAGGVQVVTGLRALVLLATREWLPGARYLVAAGGTLGVAVPVSASVALHPELAVTTRLAATEELDSTHSLLGSRLLVQAGVAVVVRPARRQEPDPWR